jgi:S1-C subfamily serine protease
MAEKTPQITKITSSKTTEKPKPSAGKPKKSGTYGIQKPQLLMAAFFVIVSASSGFFGGWFASQNKDNILNGTSTSAKQQIVSSESQLINSIAKTVGPSVVSVNVTSQSAAGNLGFFGFSVPSSQQSAGTGIILNSDGIVMTNRHVVPASASQVSVTLSDGTELDNVSVLGRTNDGDSLDVAFLKINDKKGKNLTPAKLGDSSKMQVGDKVVAIGNALGQFQNTVTDGIISGFGRSVQASDQMSSASETLQNLFQTDAAINAGNSGGPLVNVNSEVIGLNTAIAGNAQNIGFAIPINDIAGLVKSVLNKGKLERPYLGVRFVSLTDDLAYQYNLSVKRGAYIAPGQGQVSILPDSPAERAGLKEKDIITKVDNTNIDENHSLTSVLGQHVVGDNVTLTIVRDGKTQTIKATLEAAPQS